MPVTYHLEGVIYIYNMSEIGSNFPELSRYMCLQKTICKWEQPAVCWTESSIVSFLRCCYPFCNPLFFFPSEIRVLCSVNLFLIYCYTLKTFSHLQSPLYSQKDSWLHFVFYSNNCPFTKFLIHMSKKLSNYTSPKCTQRHPNRRWIIRTCVDLKWNASWRTQETLRVTSMHGADL